MNFIIKHIKLSVFFIVLLSFIGISLVYFTLSFRYGYLGYALKFLTTLLFLSLGVYLFIVFLFSLKNRRQSEAVLPELRSGLLEFLRMTGFLCVLICDFFIVLLTIAMIIDSSPAIKIIMLMVAGGAVTMNITYFRNRIKGGQLKDWLKIKLAPFLLLLISAGFFGFSLYGTVRCAMDLSNLNNPSITILYNASLKHHYVNKAPNYYTLEGLDTDGKAVSFHLGNTKLDVEDYAMIKVEYLPNSRSVLRVLVPSASSEK